jgi:hypothetical protein
MTNAPRHPRDYGGSFSLHNAEDGTPVREMFELGGRLLLITDKCVYAVQMADQVDPDRTNPALPHNFQQKLFDHGVQSDLLCRSLLHAKGLFRTEFQKIDVPNAMQHSLDAFTELASMQAAASSFKADESAAIEKAAHVTRKDGSHALPSVGDVQGRCKSFAQHADHTAGALLSIVRLFYPEMKGKNWDEFLQMIERLHGKDDNYFKVLELTVPLLNMVRNLRNCLGHQNLKGAVTRDFALEADGQVWVPSIELDFRASSFPRCSIANVMAETTNRLLDSFEMITLHICAKHVQPFASMPMTIAPLNDDYRKAWHVRFAYVGVMADLAVGRQIIGAHKIQIVDLGARHELVNLDRACGFQRNVLELVFRHFKIAIGIDLVALDDVVGRHLVAGFGIDLLIADAMTRLPVDLIERDFFGFRRSRIKRDRACHQRQPQKTLPVGARGHDSQSPNQRLSQI